MPCGSGLQTAMKIWRIFIRALESAPTVASVCLLLTHPASAAEPLYPLHIAGHRPPCSQVEGLPIVPEDPGAVVTGTGTRCYGTDPRELVLMMPLDAQVWLETAAPHPAEWIRVGPVLVDAQRYQVPPLGLTLVESADGERYWMMVETATSAGRSD